MRLGMSHTTQTNLYTLRTCTVLCKSIANDNQWISHFVLTIYSRYIGETSHRWANVKTINQWDMGKICMMSRWDKQGWLLSDWLICYPCTQTLFECELQKILKTKMPLERAIPCCLCFIACCGVLEKCWRFFHFSLF